jgi:hypothetical protein
LEFYHPKKKKNQTHWRRGEKKKKRVNRDGRGAGEEKKKKKTRVNGDGRGAGEEKKKKRKKNRE